MGRKFTPTADSPYYPPRARWYSFIYTPGDLIRRRLALDRLRLPQGMTAVETVAAFLVPGLAVRLRGPALWGYAALGACAALLAVFIVGMGYSCANLALGLLISTHATGFVYYCNPLLAAQPFRWRLSFTLLVLLSIVLLLYLPARRVLEEHWLVPLRVHGRVMVIRRMPLMAPVQRGDWLAYRLDETEIGENYHGGTVLLTGGITLGRVLAVAGDTVTFTNGSYLVNGVAQASLPHMPDRGGWLVAEKHWFIWPNLGISGYGDVGEARLGGALLGLANVAETNYFGEPFHRWFWRKQTLP